MNNTKIPLSRYRFRFIVSSAFGVPGYAGSMLRGAFGHALKELCCIKKHAACQQCSLYHDCLYPAIFEAPPQQHSLQKFSQIPNPYVIEPGQTEQLHYSVNDCFEFHMVLTGLAVKQLSLIILAWQRAFERGMAKNKGKGKLLDVALQNADNHTQIIYNQDTKTIKQHDQYLVLPEEKELNSLRLKFITPLRIQRNSKPLDADTLKIRDLLVTLARRVNLVNEFHNQIIVINDFSALISAIEEIEMHSQLHWQDWTRYSNRQKQKMTLGGVMGNITITGKLAPFIPILYMGQWLHLGKNATFGMGHYQLELVS